MLGDQIIEPISLIAYYSVDKLLNTCDFYDNTTVTYANEVLQQSITTFSYCHILMLCVFVLVVCTYKTVTIISSIKHSKRCLDV